MLLAALSRQPPEFLILEDISIVGKKAGQEEERRGKQECSLLREITKSPPMPLILHPLQSDITESLSLFPPSLHRNDPKQWLRWINNTRAEHKHVLPFSQQHASTTDGEFLRHETRRVRLTDSGNGRKRKEHNQIPAAELNSIRLDGAVPRAKCRGGNWARAEVGFAGLGLVSERTGGGGEDLLFSLCS